MSDSLSGSGQCVLEVAHCQTVFRENEAGILYNLDSGRLSQVPVAGDAPHVIQLTQTFAGDKCWTLGGGRS